ncbi:Cas10/Cmr2 second palm domain-containing protein [Micromonospora musae]|uniref:Type III-B CRISPR-associated protein Cas10/Cmr2 n=1 Tax=Micromonospora musae TaxID=1894970 RepID=A0A3A9Y8M2_9ACTN|nr:type III-B CRISPR-associated protein Cas10/Cmr2 [Micromonospora musae]RKN33835.1 type III-B CRISPR-associated protein Cas10/Cmr2 [Micromonospora musae]
MSDPDVTATTGADGRDLVMIALSGVQSFIAESRTTADLHAASAIVGRLASTAAEVCAAAVDAEVVFPSAVSAMTSATDGLADAVVAVPNRVVALVRSGSGARVAAAAAAEIREQWAGWVRDVLHREVPTPGMPSVQWVAVPAGPGGYPAQWKLAQEALAARKRVRDFPGGGQCEWPGQRLCAQSPRWPAEDKRPPDAPAHETDLLSAANWVKRRWGRGPGTADEERIGFPSTSSIASAPYRRLILDRLGEDEVRQAVTALRDAVRPLTRVRESPVPGLIVPPDAEHAGLARWLAESAGPWVYPDAWDARRLHREFGRDAADRRDFGRLAAAGRRATNGLAHALAPERSDGLQPPAYLAVVAQDLDGMGRFLNDRASVSPAVHRQISARLSKLAGAQRAALRARRLLGVPVYTGGDDLLAFAPATTAIDAARDCHQLVPLDALPTASTAVLYFHRGSSLRRAVVEVTRLLHDAKDSHPDKHALAVGFLRRSGARESTIQPWVPAPELATALPAGGTAADLLAVFAAEPQRRRLSPRLLGELTRDADEFADRHLPEDLYEAELTRLVVRHGGAPADAKALACLGYLERAGRPARGDGRRTPERAARVAVFLRQECRPLPAHSTGVAR